MIEHERSYVFTHEGAHAFLCEHGGKGLAGYKYANYKHIEDHYLGKGMRVRKSHAYGYDTGNDEKEHSLLCYSRYPHRETLCDCGMDGPKALSEPSFVFTRKTGDKAKGYRFEFEEKITEALAEQLIATAIMQVKKSRYTIQLPKAKDAYTVTMDFIEEPMRIAILEIEATSEVVFPVPTDVAHKLFGVQLKECPLCAYDLFNRHIGIAGGPSSGKSEMAKILSHTLNTGYNANSFHVTEFATTFIQKYGKSPNFWEEFFIWHGQHEREHSADLANIVISDCPTFLTYVYLLHLPKDKFSPDTALVLAKMYKRVLFDVGWYSDLILLELKDYRENAVRYQSFEEALRIQSRVRGFLDDHNIQYSLYDYTKKDEILRDLFYINSQESHD